MFDFRTIENIGKKHSGWSYFFNTIIQKYLIYYQFKGFLYDSNVLHSDLKKSFPKIFKNLTEIELDFPYEMKLKILYFGFTEQIIIVERNSRSRRFKDNFCK